MSGDETRAVGSTRGPLNGVRVLELGNFIATPTAGRMLAEFGVHVIKVERPLTGDELRAWRRGQGDTSLLCRTMARGKRSVTLDLKRPEGRASRLRWPPSATLSLRTSVRGRWSDSGWGRPSSRPRAGHYSGARQRLRTDRPYRDRPGFASVAEALGGLRNLTGDTCPGAWTGTPL